MGSVICPHCYGEEGKRVEMDFMDGYRDKLKSSDRFIGPVLVAEVTKAERDGNYWKCPKCGYQARLE